MPNLLASLQKHDIGHLRIIADMWGLELDSAEPDAAAEELAACLLDRRLVGELTETLPGDAPAALEALAATPEGRLPWAEFTRRFGTLRDMGPGKRDRDKPHQKPASAAETLYYRALLARAFFDTEKGPQEFAYIPEDLLDMIRGGRIIPVIETTLSPDPPGVVSEGELLGRPASPGEHGEEVLATDRLLDDATTLLAALRLGITPPETLIPRTIVQEFLRAAGLIRKSAPQPEPVKRFLEAPRSEALKLLSDAWLDSEGFNELHLLPGLACEGEWTNQPAVTREFLLHLLEALPDGKWWGLAAFIRAVKEKYPDYQRPAGDYDSWFIRRQSDGAYLRGFAHWDQVDGVLIHFLITGVMHWLGLVDLSRGKQSEALGAFRLIPGPPPTEEKGKLTVASNGMITIPRSFSRAARYQLSRFGEWEEEKADAYRYRVTPLSLRRAGEQGLKIEHLLTLLSRYADAGIPPVLVKALKGWESHGTEARVQNQVVLRVSRPEILEELRKSKAARFLGENLGPTSVVVKEGAQAKVMAALTEMGLLAEDETQATAQPAASPEKH